MKLLDLNIFKGKYLDNVIKFVKKEDFDILTFQEVTAGEVSFNNHECFQLLLDSLPLSGELVKTWNYRNDKSSYFGNATFFKKKLKVLERKIIWLKEFQEIEKDTKSEDVPRCAFSLLIEKDDRRFYIVNSHLAWGPTPFDEEYKLVQARKLFDYLKDLKYPFILSGDFNLTSDSQVVFWMSSLGRNLTVENKITNTLNERNHYARTLFPPGLAIDYIFVDRRIKINKFNVDSSPDLSDHLPLIVEFEI